MEAIESRNKRVTLDKQEIICNNKENIAAGRGPCPTFEVRFCCEKIETHFEWITSPPEYDEYQGKIKDARTRTVTGDLC